MARIHGRRGRLYAGLASDTAAAEPIAFLNRWSLNQSSDRVDVTSFGDDTKVYVQGLPDATGTFAGFYDTASDQLYAAARDGLARKTYLYPDTTASGTYYVGTAFFDFNIEDGVDGAVTISGSFAAASSFAKVGP